MLALDRIDKNKPFIIYDIPSREELYCISKYFGKDDLITSVDLMFYLRYIPETKKVGFGSYINSQCGRDVFKKIMEITLQNT